KPVVSLVQKAKRTPGFAVAITGDHSVGNDFNTLSQRDLEHGELAFGLPAALVVLVLVFGAVVAGLVPVLMAILSILAGLGIVAVVSVVAALTLLPALLGVLGDRVNTLRVPILGRSLGRADSLEGRFWRRIVDGVLRRPALSLVLAAGLMIAAAVPVLGLHIGASGVSTLPDNLPSKQGYIALQSEFTAQNPSAV